VALKCEYLFCAKKESWQKKEVEQQQQQHNANAA
jgi:hypothetical protein